MQPTEQLRTDEHLTLLVMQLAQRGLAVLIPHIIEGALWTIERGRLWVFLDAEAGIQDDY